MLFVKYFLDLIKVTFNDFVKIFTLNLKNNTKLIIYL